jgi:hypothetical protein
MTHTPSLGHCVALRHGMQGLGELHAAHFSLETAP